MNTYRISKRKNGRFDFTCENDGHVWPVGYCAAYKEWWTGDHPVPSSQHSIDAYQATGDKHHSNGHETEEEAAACYKEWLLDHRLSLMLDHKDARYRCEVCGEWTNLCATLETTTWNLCQQHNTREEAAKLLYIGPTTVIWSSW